MQGEQGQLPLYADFSSPVMWFRYTWIILAHNRLPALLWVSIASAYLPPEIEISGQESWFEFAEKVGVSRREYANMKSSQPEWPHLESFQVDSRLLADKTVVKLEPQPLPPPTKLPPPVAPAPAPAKSWQQSRQELDKYYARANLPIARMGNPAGDFDFHVRTNAPLVRRHATNEAHAKEMLMFGLFRNEAQTWLLKNIPNWQSLPFDLLVQRVRQCPREGVDPLSFRQQPLQDHNPRAGVAAEGSSASLGSAARATLDERLRAHPKYQFLRPVQNLQRAFPWKKWVQNRREALSDMDLTNAERAFVLLGMFQREAGVELRRLFPGVDEMPYKPLCERLKNGPH